MRKRKGLLIILLALTAIIAGCAKQPATQPRQSGYNDAVDLQQKCGELADQLLSSVPGTSLKGYVGLPTSFVNENNPGQTSPLGRMISESMYHEFNQRGFPTREYRLSGSLLTPAGANDAALARKLKNQKWAALLVGTYQVEKDATFVNARLIRGSDGLVLRTGELVLPNTPLILSMTRGDTSTTYISSQSAPVLPPSYPSLSGPVVQSGTASIQIVQGR